MSEVKSKEKTGRENGLLSYVPLTVAALITGGFSWYVNILSQEWVVLDHVHATRLGHFLAGTPNDMAATLGGLVGSLTLVWVIASVVQQSMELRAQRAEFAEMVRAQDAQVAALNAQAAIFEDEKLRRDQTVAKEELDLILWHLKGDFGVLNGFNLVVARSIVKADEAILAETVNFFTEPASTVDEDITFIHYYSQLTSVLSFLERQQADGRKVIAIDGLSRAALSTLISGAEKLMSVSTKLSEAQSYRFQRLHAGELLSALTSIHSRKDLWNWESSGRFWRIP